MVSGVSHGREIQFYMLTASCSSRITINIFAAKHSLGVPISNSFQSEINLLLWDSSKPLESIPIN